MLDPDTGGIAVYPMPDPEARDPHTPIVTRSGDLWFTLQNSNMIGRLVPDTGDIRLTATPTVGARPYGIDEDSSGMIWIAYRGAPKIARVNPDCWEIREFETPNPDPESHHGNYYIRRLSINSNDMIWYVDSGRGYLGRLDPETGGITEWLTPNGHRSHPYAIRVVDDVVWLNESEMRPDVLLRFDPDTEQFQSWPIPSGIGIIRNMRATHDGNLVIHQSSTNTVGLIPDRPPKLVGAGSLPALIRREFRGGRQRSGKGYPGMRFEFGDRTRQMKAELECFLQEHVYPVEKLYFEQVETAENRWSSPPLMAQLKKKAKAAGLWNLFIPTEHSEHGGKDSAISPTRRWPKRWVACSGRPRSSIAVHPIPGTWKS